MAYGLSIRNALGQETLRIDDRTPRMLGSVDTPEFASGSRSGTISHPAFAGREAFWWIEQMQSGAAVSYDFNIVRSGNSLVWTINITQSLFGGPLRPLTIFYGVY